MVSIETTSTDYILYAIEQRQNKPLDFSLCYQRILTLEYLLFYFSEKREEKKKEGSSFELSIFKTCHFNTTVASRTLTVYDHFIYFFFFIYINGIQILGLQPRLTGSLKGYHFHPIKEKDL